MSENDDPIEEVEETEEIENDPDDTILREAVDDLRKSLGVSKSDFENDLGDLSPSAQYKALKRTKTLLQKQIKKRERNKKIIPTPTGDNEKPFGEGTINELKNGTKKVTWSIPVAKLLRADPQKTIY